MVVARIPAKCPTAGRDYSAPQGGGSGCPEKFCPITISQVISTGYQVVRCFPGILAHRMEVNLPFSSRQKAFRQGDGLADSVWFIQGVIRQHQDDLRPLNITFVDVKKGLRLGFPLIHSGGGCTLGISTTIFRPSA